VTLKIESDFAQYFYGDLKPYVHYVPVKKDYSDLISQIEWLRQNDDVAK